MTERIKDLNKQLPPDPGFRPGVDVGGADYLPADSSGPEIIRPIGSGRSLTPWELNHIQSARLSDNSDATKLEEK